MFLYHQLLARAAEGKPVRVALIGAGKFGSMFLAQVPTTPGLTVTHIADLRVDSAKDACRHVGWDEGLIAATRFTDDATSAIAADDVDVVVEATGHPRAGIAHAQAAFGAGKHIVMVNVEADVLAGPALAREAAAAGVVYTMAYGDQPALVAELVEWARCTGFDVTAAGKGTRYEPHFHQSTPENVWTQFGITPDAAKAAGMNPKMFNSFVDGTKSGIEMAAIANACELNVPSDGLSFFPCGAHDLARTLRPKADGGQLEGKGFVEVVSSQERDGREVAGHLRQGVYVVIEAPNDYAAACFGQYGLHPDPSGRYAAMYKPYHLIGLELSLSIQLAALEGKATGSARAFVGDVVACAKTDLSAGTTLDGEGGFCVWGKLAPADRSVAQRYLPIGLAQDVVLTKPVAAGEVVRLSDVQLDAGDEALTRLRGGMTPAPQIKFAAE
ncbi:MAG: Gfo/Idh/MocA family oxidoreductase [Pseudomonadota bacterium]